MARRSVAIRKEVDQREHSGEFDAALDDDGARQAESRMNTSGDIAIKRRLMLQVMKFSKAELIAKWKDEETAETMLTIAKNVDEFVKHTETTLEMAKAAQARMWLTSMIVYPGTAKGAEK
jgi:hypothetical protein